MMVGTSAGDLGSLLLGWWSVKVFDKETVCVTFVLWWEGVRHTKRTPKGRRVTGVRMRGRVVPTVAGEVEFYFPPKSNESQEVF